MGDRIWITDTYRQGPSHPRRRSCSSSACHASLAHCLLYADKGLELADSNSAATHLAIPFLIRRLVQSLLANDDPYPNIQGLLITSSHQSRSMCRLLYPLTKCNCLKI
ncbi:hypothetical protein PVAP13_9KG311868 [Panicum virgatum]|uniref:Uncharacterized protein n=1 Tax=Panicum virgatum TaxID=38727 RepID=A0A8T0N9C6_PANVG|nr:hypothetical protein PVAP13_9KG311868 [Panicum virgatum]